MGIAAIAGLTYLTPHVRLNTSEANTGSMSVTSWP